MTNNGISQQEAFRSYWTDQLPRAEFTEVISLLAASDASLRLFYAGLAVADRPSRDRAAGFLAALASPAGARVHGPDISAKAGTLLNKWMKRDPANTKAQLPAEDREGAG